MRAMVVAKACKPRCPSAACSTNNNHIFNTSTTSNNNHLNNSYCHRSLNCWSRSRCPRTLALPL